MNIDGIKFYNTNLCILNNTGNHTVYILIDLEKLNSLESFFAGKSYLKSVRFAKNLKSSNIRKLNHMFLRCYSLTSIDFSNFNTENVYNMRYMFSECRSLTSIDLSHFNTKNLKFTSFMFYDCRSLISIDLSNLNFS